MKKLLLFSCSFFLLIGCTLKKQKNLLPLPTSDKKIIVAYVMGFEDDWGPNFEKAKQITHINYAFANIKDGKVIEGSDTDTEMLKKLNGLKQINKELKILISVGGWTWSKNFSDAALTQESREKFANSAIEFMLKHQIDGIDLDWEYPGLPGDGNVHRPEDKENFTAILKLIREKLDRISTAKNSYLLTIATGASQAYLDHTNMREAHKYLDFINIMAYDFHTGGGKTGHNASLMPSNFDDSNQPISATNALNQHINAGIPVEKIILGVPFYGRWKKGVNPKNNGLFQVGNGAAGSFNYNEIVDSLKSNKGFITHWDDSAKVPYVYRLKDSLFLSYDDERSMKYKVDFVKEKQLGGIMFWQFGGDSKGSLLKTISENLYK